MGRCTFLVILLFGVAIMVILGWLNPYVSRRHDQLLWTVDHNYIEIPVDRRYSKGVYMFFAIIINVTILIAIRWSAVMPDAIFKKYWIDVLINIALSVIIQVSYINIAFYCEKKKSHRLRRYYAMHYGVKTKDRPYYRRRKNNSKNY